MTAPHLATLGIQIDNSAITGATADLGRLGAAGEAAATRTRQAWQGAGNVFQRGGFATGGRAAQEIMQSMIRDQQALAPALTQTTRAAANLRQGLVGIALQATATSGPVGRLAQAVLLFGGGTTAIIAVAAAVGVLALAYQRLTADARAATKALNDLIDAQLKQREAERGTAIRQFEGLAILREGVRLAQASLDAAREADAQGRGTAAQSERAIADAQRDLNKALFAHNQLLRESRDIESGAAREERLKREAEHARALVARREELIAAAEREVRLFGVGAEIRSEILGQEAKLTQEQQQRYTRALLDLEAARERKELLEAEAALTAAGVRARAELSTRAVPGAPTPIVPDLEPEVFDAFLREAERVAREVDRLFGDPDLFRAMGESFEFFFREALADGELAFEAFADALLRTWVDLAVKLAREEFLKTALAGQLKDFIAANQKTLAGIGVGVGVGVGTASPIAGAAAGAGSTALLQLAAGGLTNPLGIAAAGVAGLVGGLLGLGQSARVARERLREFQRSMEGFRASLTASELDDQLLALRRQADEQRRLLREAFQDDRRGNVEWGRQMGEINDLEDRRADALRAEAAALRQAHIEDSEIRQLRAEGFVREADALAFALEQQRELAEARRREADEAEITALQAAHAAEAIRRAADLERQRAETIEDLQVRFLRATGRGAEAEDFAFALAQQREMAEAIRANADAAYLARLANVQLAEAQARASEQIQTTIAGLTATIATLRTFTNALRLGPLTGLSPVQQLAEARRQYEQVLTAAQGGDQAAAGRLPDAARAFLEASRAVNASGGRFQVDFTRVLRETEAVAAMFEGQRSIQERQLAALKFIGDEIGDVVPDWPIEEIADSVFEIGDVLRDWPIEQIADDLGRLARPGLELGDVPTWPIEEIADSVATTAAAVQTGNEILARALTETNARLAAVEAGLAKTNRTLEGARL